MPLSTQTPEVEDLPRVSIDYFGDEIFLENHSKRLELAAIDGKRRKILPTLTLEQALDRLFYPSIYDLFEEQSFEYPGPLKYTEYFRVFDYTQTLRLLELAIISFSSPNSDIDIEELLILENLIRKYRNYAGDQERHFIKGGFDNEAMRLEIEIYSFFRGYNLNQESQGYDKFDLAIELTSPILSNWINDVMTALKPLSSAANAGRKMEVIGDRNDEEIGLDIIYKSLNECLGRLSVECAANIYQSLRVIGKYLSGEINEQYAERLKRIEFILIGYFKPSPQLAND